MIRLNSNRIIYILTFFVNLNFGALSQIEITEEGNSISYPEGRLLVQINNAQNYLLLTFENFDQEIDGEIEFEILSQHEADSALLIKAIDGADSDEIVNFIIDFQNNSIESFHKKRERSTAKGKGLVLFYSDKRNKDKCVIKD